MKPVLLLLAVSVAALSSCTTSYKSGQTPDDVYYSPARPQSDEYVRTDKDRDDDRYYSNDEYYDDRYLRMKVRNRSRWSELDDWYYYGNRNTYNYSHINFGSPWTTYSYWNTYYNPYCYSCCVVVNPKTVAYSKPRAFNLNAYNSTVNGKTNANSKSVRNSNNTYSAPRNINSNSSGSGNVLRDIFGGGNKSGSSNNNSSSSSSSSNNSSSGSSSGKSGGSAPVRKF